MKRITSLILALLLVLSILFTAASCKRNADSDNADSKGKSVESTSPSSESSVSPLLWKVTDAQGHTLYLFGTIHIGDERNDEVLGLISPVLEGCDALAVEFDTVAYEKSYQKIMNDMKQFLLLDGSVVSDYMPEELYNRSYELLKNAKLSPNAFTHYNLAWWSQMVESAMMTQYTELDADKAMDSLLIKHAYSKEIPVLEVESSEFQMSLLNSFDNGLYLMMIEEALDSTDTYGKDLDKLYELWLAGNRDELWAFIADEDDITDSDKQYTEEQIALAEDYSREMLDKRNLNMRDKAVEYLNSGDTVFFAVGSAHMANESGLVKLLSDAGYTVEQIKY